MATRFAGGDSGSGRSGIALALRGILDILYDHFVRAGTWKVHDPSPERLLSEMPDHAPGQAVVGAIGYSGHPGQPHGPGIFAVGDVVAGATTATAG